MARLFAGVTGKTGVELHRLGSSSVTARLANWNAMLHLVLRWDYSYELRLKTIVNEQSIYTWEQARDVLLCKGNLARDAYLAANDERLMQNVQVLEAPPRYLPAGAWCGPRDGSTYRTPEHDRCPCCGHDPNAEHIEQRRRRKPKPEIVF